MPGTSQRTSSHESEEGSEAENDTQEEIPGAAEENLILREPPVFKAPAHFKRVEYRAEAASEFDFDDVASEDFELWLVRAPAMIKLKHLEGLNVPEAGSSTSFKARKTTYQLSDAQIKGDMESMTAFLPRKAKGNRLFKAAVPFKRKLAVTIAGDAEEVEDEIEEAPRSMAQRHPQPKFKYIFGAPGSISQEAALPEYPVEDTRPKKKRKA